MLHIKKGKIFDDLAFFASAKITVYFLTVFFLAVFFLAVPFFFFAAGFFFVAAFFAGFFVAMLFPFCSSFFWAFSDSF